MQISENTGKVIKIKSPYHYILRDSKSKQIVMIELDPQSQLSKNKLKKETQQIENTSYFHLLKQISQKQLGYNFVKKQTHQFRDEFRKGNIFLNGQSIVKKYNKESKIQIVCENLESTIQEIYQCLVAKVQGLKLLLYVIESGIFLNFYFSELKLPKPTEMFSKTIWERSQEYFKENLQGQFVQIKVNGFQKYRQQVNIYGEILRRENGEDLKQKIIADGYAQLSKNGQRYLASQKLALYQNLCLKAIQNKLGLYQSQKKSKATHQAQQLKYKQWEQWSKDKLTIKSLKNEEEDLKNIMEEFRKQLLNKIDINKARQLVQLIITLFDNQVNNKNIIYIEDCVKITISALTTLYINFNNNLENGDHIKFINKALTLLLFYLSQMQKIEGNNKKVLSGQFDKVVRFVFKLCFIGNQTFHAKIFGKKKESDFQSFCFQSAYLNGGISSMSQQSDYQDNDKSKQVNKNQKKLNSMYMKIRINSTLLISQIFKIYPAIVENNWDICVKPNILSLQFFKYLQKMPINAQQVHITNNQKKQIANLMRTNFGQHSLVLLVVFQTNLKVKLNALSCLIQMIINFQGKKMIDTTDKVYIEKLLKDTKSSYVPRSFIVFSGLRNALYFMLFSLHYQKNIQVIMQTFKALSELCFHSTLMDKMGFEEGMGLLMQNYIFPVIQFSWQLLELRQLKILCVSFLGVLVSTQKKWTQIQQLYLLSSGDKNINKKLLEIIQISRQSCVNPQQDKAVIQITKYFMKLGKRYYWALFYTIWKQDSVWTYLCSFYLKNPSINFLKFVEQVLKCHFDELHLIQQERMVVISEKDEKTLTKCSEQISKIMNKLVQVYSEIKTADCYACLLNTLTNLDYNVWANNQYSYARQFLQYCFKSLIKQGEVEPPNNIERFDGLKKLMNNSYVRIGLIKLVGYMSFCNQFKTPEYTLQAIKILLEFARNYKSPNSIVKITWGLSNWSRIEKFSVGLEKAELIECLEYLITHSKSQKQKIASNSTRGVGFFIQNVGKQLDLEKCREAIINNLSHSIVKVRTNSTKTLRNMVQGLTPKQINYMIPTLEANLLKNNYHLQIQTLLLLKDLSNPIPKNKLIIRYTQILTNLNSHTTMEYQFSEIRAIKHLRKTILQEIICMPEELLENNSIWKQIIVSIYGFLSDSKEQSIRKEENDKNILQMGFQKGEEAQNTIFNIENSKKYDEEKQITTQMTMQAICFVANQLDISLIENVRNLGQKMNKISNEWSHLAQLKIQGNRISMGDIKI